MTLGLPLRHVKLNLRPVPASERLYLSGRQSNFPRRLHVSPITLAHNSLSFPAPGTIGGTPQRNACVTVPTCCEVLDKWHKCLGQHDSSFRVIVPVLEHGAHE